MTEFLVKKKIFNFRTLSSHLEPALSLILTVAATLWCTTSYGEEIVVSGWPLTQINTQKPAMWMGHDPILGRLTCPPLTSYDSKDNTFDNILIKSIKVHANEFMNLKSTYWTIELMDGLYFWDGSPFNAESATSFFERELENIISLKTSGTFHIPLHSVSKINNHSVKIHWFENPEFGPYILANHPFFNKNIKGKSQLQYQCVGLYKPKIQNHSVTLVPRKHYKLAGDKTISFAEIEESPLHHRIQFNAKPLRTTCQPEIVSNLSTIIFWNPDRISTWDEKFRMVIDDMFNLHDDPYNLHRANFNPRQAFFRLPHLHHAEVNKSSAESTSIDSEEKMTGFSPLQRLLSAGYERSTADLPLIEKKTGSPVTLNLQTKRPLAPQMHRLLKKRFNESGIALSITTNEGAKSSDIDGIITTTILPKNDLNYLPFLKSSRFFTISDTKRIAPFRNWIAALSNNKNLEAAKQKVVAEISSSSFPMSVIINHNHCLEKPKLSDKSLDIDWFKNLIKRF